MLPGFLFQVSSALVEEERLEIRGFGNRRMDRVILTLLSELEQPQLGVLPHGPLSHDILQLALLQVERAG
jgi:hypothetical protein